jgi:DNA-binding transcriptional ArsR family regulator
MVQPSDTSGQSHGLEPGRLLGFDDAQMLAERLKLLSDPSRLRMIYALLEAGEICVRDLARLVEASESATSHQLRQVRLAGLVRARKRGRAVTSPLDHRFPTRGLVHGCQGGGRVPDRLVGV